MWVKGRTGMIEQESDSTRRDQLRSIRSGFSYLNDVLLIPMFTIIILETSQNMQGAQTLLLFEVSNIGFCITFFIEWLLGWAMASSTRSYLFNFNNILNLISCIPFGYAFQSVRMFRVLRVVRVFRLAIRARRYRGRGERLLKVLSLVGSTVLAGALALRIVEPETTEHFTHALWWSIVTVSTVGYGDITPATDAGRVVATVLIIFGVGVVGYIAGFMASVLDVDEEEARMASLERIEENMLRIMEHLELEPAQSETADINSASSPQRGSG